jgi:hypothetical protein
MQRRSEKLRQKSFSVKPVYNEHPWDPQKVAVVQSVVTVCRLLKLIRSNFKMVFCRYYSFNLV